MAKASTPLDPAIQRVRLDKLRFIEISEAELEALERGSLESVFFNLALTVFSVAISFSVTLATTTITSTRTFIVFVVVIVVGYLAGATFGLLFWIYRRSLKRVSAEIRSRFPPEGVQEPSCPVD